MPLDPVLLADLHELMAPLGVRGVELARSVQLLHRTAEQAVPSLVGWKLTLLVQQQPVTVASLDAGLGPHPVSASLRVSLTSILGYAASGHLILYAAEPHAFTLLSAAAARASQLPGAVFRVDEDLQGYPSSGVTGLKEATTINRAIGVLVASGDTVDGARARLDRQASATNLSLYRTAKRLISHHARRHVA